MDSPFDDPEVRALMAEYGVVHKPGMAAEFMTELAPLLAAEGIDLDDVGDTDLATLNAAFDRAVTRHNQALQQGPATSGSAFGIARAQPASENLAPLIRMDSARSRRRTQTQQAAIDTRTVKDFRAWLMRNPDLDGRAVTTGTRELTALMEVARMNGIDPNSPASIDELIDLIYDITEDDDAVEEALDTLHDYVHFRLETSDDAGWEDAHEAIEDVESPGTGVLSAALASIDDHTPEERLAALAEVRVISAVRDLLAWIGKSRQITQSGGIRRADIEQVAGMLGIPAIGVNKLVPGEKDVTQALSMDDVPNLRAWWESLRIAELIETTATRVKPGPAAAEWLDESMPPLELAEMLAGLFVATVITDSGYAFAAPSGAAVIEKLIDALNPEIDAAEVDAEPDLFAQVMERLAESRMQRLAQVGLLESDASSRLVVPGPLRAIVARGILLAMAFLDAGTDEADADDEGHWDD